jgi:hypothetical protein
MDLSKSPMETEALLQPSIRKTCCLMISEKQPLKCEAGIIMSKMKKNSFCRTDLMIFSTIYNDVTSILKKIIPLNPQDNFVNKKQSVVNK